MSPKNDNLRQRKPTEVEGKTDQKVEGVLTKDERKRITSPTNATRAKTHRIWMRSVMIVSLMIIVYCFSKKEKGTRFALQKETIPLRSQRFPCSELYLKDLNAFPKCVPKICGRFVCDTIIDGTEMDSLLGIAIAGISLGGSSGGVSILDLHSGALSKGENFINLYKTPESKVLFKKIHIISYKSVKAKVKRAIAEHFEIDESSLFLTHPTFFSRITNATAKTVHDEYWHPHVDKETYGSFHYTSLLYLTDYNKDFTGGRFIFVDGNENDSTKITIEPKRGRISGFTSGAENLHYIEKVETGTRYALTISFTCDSTKSIDDPKFESELI